MSNLVIGSLHDKINDYLIPQWIDYYKKLNAEKIVFLIESCSAEAYEQLIQAGIECHFLGGPWYETQARNRLYSECAKYNPDWVLMAVSGEIFEDRFIEDLPKLMEQPVNWHAFRIFHFFESTIEFRMDGTWGLSTSQFDVTRLFRHNVPGIDYTFGDATKNMHGQEYPTGICKTPGGRTTTRIKRMGASRYGAFLAKCLIRGKSYSGDDFMVHCMGNMKTMPWIESETWEEFAIRAKNLFSELTFT